MLLSTNLTTVLNEITQEEKCYSEETVGYFSDERPSKSKDKLLVSWGCQKLFWAGFSFEAVVQLLVQFNWSGTKGKENHKMNFFFQENVFICFWQAVPQVDLLPSAIIFENCILYSETSTYPEMFPICMVGSFSFIKTSSY